MIIYFLTASRRSARGGQPASEMSSPPSQRRRVDSSADLAAMPSSPPAGNVQEEMSLFSSPRGSVMGERIFQNFIDSSIAWII